MFRETSIFSLLLLGTLAFLSWQGSLPKPLAAVREKTEPEPTPSADSASTNLHPKLTNANPANPISKTTPRQFTNLELSADWYEPSEEDFKPAYERDAANSAKQPWHDYWGWVKSFYQGNFFDAGWTKRCKELVAAVHTKERQLALRIKLNSLGRIIAAEWAKTNAGRKIDSSKLLSWGNRLLEAKKNDNGEGAGIEKEIELIAKEVGVEL